MDTLCECVEGVGETWDSTEGKKGWGGGKRNDSTRSIDEKKQKKASAIPQNICNQCPVRVSTFFFWIERSGIGESRG